MKNKHLQLKSPSSWFRARHALEMHLPNMLHVSMQIYVGRE